MKKYLLIIPLIIGFLFSCQKEIRPFYPAKASFSISALFLGTNYLDEIVKVGTHDELTFKNESTYADSVLWDFGNQQIADTYDAKYAYDSAGTYTITLIVFNKNGSKSSYSRKIQVMERVIKKLTITTLNLNKLTPFYNGTHTFSKADLWVEIKFDQEWDTDADRPDGSIAAPVIYKSPVFTNIDSGFHGTLTYELPENPKAIINYPVRNATYPIFPSTGRGTIVEWYGKDNSGTYLLGSSWGTGLHLLSGGGNPATSLAFDLGFSVPDRVMANEVKFDCVYQ